MQSTRLLLGAFVLCAFFISYPSSGQAPQDRSAPQARPAPDQGKRPQPDKGRPQGGNHDRPRIQPVRPSPGKPNPGKPPSRPNPPGNNRPSRPNPGRPPSRPNPGRPNPGHRPGPRPPQWGHRPPHRPSYSFRPRDRSYLHRYYLNRLAGINRGFRIHLFVGSFFPYADIPYITPLPPDLYGTLPPPPPGYELGYYEGYVVVYDPITYYIADVIDLLQY